MMFSYAKKLAFGFFLPAATLVALTVGTIEESFALTPEVSLNGGSKKRVLTTAVRRSAQDKPTKATAEHVSEVHDAVAPADRSHSVGRTNRGRLKGSILLPKKGDGFIRRSIHAYGTVDTIRYVEIASAKVATLYEGTVPIVVGAISRKKGGRLRKHKSHQSGRDADIGYFRKGNKALRHFRSMNKRSLDAEKSWAYLEALLETGAVQYVFVDYRLQKHLRQAAKNMGWPNSELDEIFQYPRGRKSRVGIIRHSSGHADHFHVRFTCPKNHRLCTK